MDSSLLNKGQVAVHDNGVVVIKSPRDVADVNKDKHGVYHVPMTKK